MKRLISALLSLVMILSLCNGVALSAHAADGSITATAVETYTQSEAAQDVVIRLSVSDLTENYCAFYIDSGVEMPEGFEIKGFTTSNEEFQIKEADFNAEIGTLNYDPVSSENSLPASTYFDVLISAPANAYGEYTFTFLDVCATDAAYEPVAEAESITATLTIEEAGPTDPYTAEITASTDTVVNGDTIIVNVNVDGTVGKFNSAMIQVNYDPDYMSFDYGVCNQTMGAEDVAADFDDNLTGIVTIVDYGEELTAGEAVYTLTFTAIDGGCTGVSIDANFSTAEHAEEDDLIAAVYPDGHLDVTINHKVTVNGSAEGSVTPSGTASYDVVIPNYNPNFNYTVTAKVNGEDVEVVDNGDGTFTVENVGDDLEITYELGEAKSYAVNWIGDLDGITITGTTATYGENFDVSLPMRKEPTEVDEGVEYNATISIGNTVIKTLSSGQSYTIPGTEITDVITVNVEQIPIPATGSNKITVSVSGDPGVAIKGETSNTVFVDPGTEITLVLTPELGYEYVVTVGSGNPVEFDEYDEYTFTAQESVEIKVEKTVSTIHADVKKYLTLDADTSAGTMWLVTITPDEAGSELENKVYSFDGKNMFWSEEYQAYCYLVIAATMEDVDLTLINIVGGTATEIDYDMDVNKSNVVDVNDAQLVWNMYTIKYTDFESMTVEKFLRADVNTDKTVSTMDAQYIIDDLM